MEIKVLGACCGNCGKLEAMVRGVVKEFGADARVEKVTDLKDIMKYGVLTTPGLVIDGQLKVAGRLPSKAEVTSWITTALANAG
jgi:small redox-active disulfide protein 2